MPEMMTDLVEVPPETPENVATQDAPEVDPEDVAPVLDIDWEA